MNRRSRMRTALTSTLPTLLAVPVLCLLAVAGAVPWSLLLALPVALVVHAAINFFRLERRLSEAGSRRPKTV
ncbi:hypothetical protein ACIBK8_20515 [Streptomyces sp. NPDC050161]|uniref:hypothetical protein n=1 Tax=Streptomyces sp. NPDC050161 TaxID=3365604 RepID=UPI0037BC834F